jgi:hypothetical protein
MAVGMGVGVLFQLRLGVVADAPAGKIPERVVWFSRMTARISLSRDSIGSHRSGCCVPVFPPSRSVSMQKKEIVTAIFVILEIAAIGSRK